jgi:hypothetical protein
MGVEALLVLVVPVEFDFAGQPSELYRNVYTLRN